MTYVGLTCRLALALVFALSAGSKVRSPMAFAAFRRSAGQLAAIPDRLATPSAAAVIVAEVVTAAMVLVPSLALAGEALAMCLLLVFTAILARAVARGVYATCHCFGSGSAPVSHAQLVRNGVLVALDAVALVCGPGSASSAGAFAVCVLCALAVAGTAALWDDLTDLITHP